MTTLLIGGPLNGQTVPIVPDTDEIVQHIVVTEINDTGQAVTKWRRVAYRRGEDGRYTYTENQKI